MENLLQHLLEEFISDDLLITEIALRNEDFWIGIAQGFFFEIVDYCYHFGTKRFIVHITGSTYAQKTRLDKMHQILGCFSHQCAR